MGKGTKVMLTCLHLPGFKLHLLDVEDYYRGGKQMTSLFLLQERYWVFSSVKIYILNEVSLAMWIQPSSYITALNPK